MLCPGKPGGRKEEEDRGRLAGRAVHWTAQPPGTREARPSLRRKEEPRLAFLRGNPWMQVESKSWEAEGVAVVQPRGAGGETRPILCPGWGQCLGTAVTARGAVGISWAEAGGRSTPCTVLSIRPPKRPGPPSPGGAEPARRETPGRARRPAEGSAAFTACIGGTTGRVAAPTGGGGAGRAEGPRVSPKKLWGQKAPEALLWEACVPRTGG